MFKKLSVYILVLACFGIMAFSVDFESEKRVSIKPEMPITGYEPIVVLELYTSQGCSSCPPADILLNEVRNMNNVYALSYHVDYWNYIGWKDPFSKAVYGEKQNRYNMKFGTGRNYTPQIVVNGQEHYVGSNAVKMHEVIDKYSTKRTANKVDLSNLQSDEGRIWFDYAIHGNIENKKIKILLVLNQRVTNVKRGENKNRVLTNSNIVVAQKSLSLENSKGTSDIVIPDMVKTNEKLQLVVLIENIHYDITSASKMSVKR